MPCISAKYFAIFRASSSSWRSGHHDFGEHGIVGAGHCHEVTDANEKLLVKFLSHQHAKLYVTYLHVFFCMRLYAYNTRIKVVTPTYYASRVPETERGQRVGAARSASCAYPPRA